MSDLAARTGQPAQSIAAIQQVLAACWQLGQASSLSPLLAALTP